MNSREIGLTEERIHTDWHKEFGFMRDADYAAMMDIPDLKDRLEHFTRRYIGKQRNRTYCHALESITDYVYQLYQHQQVSFARPA